MEIRMQWDGTQPEAVLQRLAQADLTVPMREIGRKLETSVLQNYNGQRSPSGIPWLPSRRARKDGGKTLIDTGRMLASLSFASGRDWVEVGYPQGGVPRWLHFGVPQNNLPAREHLGMRGVDKETVLRLTANYFESLLK